MSVLFADTFYYLAIINRLDRSHSQAVDFTAGFDGRLVTTAWIITELADALANPGTRPVFLTVLRKLRSDPRVLIIPCDQTLFDAGIDLYSRRPDKGWSLTDCISFHIMRQHNLTQALTGDHHFEQAGFTALLK